MFLAKAVSFLASNLIAAQAGTPLPLPPPNIVIILADDMGFCDLGCYGGEIRTPNVDALAAGGVRFTQFYNAGRCCPSRACLLTGLYPHQADVGWMTSGSLDRPGYRGELSRDAVTIAEVLHGAGYSTYMCGKWHVTHDDWPQGAQPNWPRQRGFDRFYGTNKGGGGYFDPDPLVRDDRRITAASDAEYRPKHFYYTDAIADQAARFVSEHARQHEDKPFFLYVAFTAPHWPLQAPAAAIAKYKGKYDGGYEPIRLRRFEREKQLGIIRPDAELSPTVGNWNEQPNKAWEARCMEVYAAQVEVMDAGVDRIVQALKEAHQFERTLVLFLSDNGGCAEKVGRQSRPNGPGTNAVPRRFTRDGRPIRDGPDALPGPDDTFIAYGRNWANVSTTPFRLYKHWVHEGGIATPLIAHWPNGIPRHGELERQPAHLIDIMPTCVAVAAARYPRQYNGHAITSLPGLSLLPAFHGRSLDRKAPIFWEHEGNRAIQSGRWKLVAKGGDGPWELYDMKADRTELHDLTGKQPERAKDMAAQWRQWAQANNVLPLNPFKIPQQQ